MASIDHAASQSWGNPASDAARVIADEALSIFRAVDAVTSQIDADARRRASLVRRASEETTASALAHLNAMSHDFDALANELDGRARQRAVRREHGD